MVSALEGKDCREVMRSIAESSVVPQERLGHIVAGMHRVLSEAIRIPTSSLKQEVSWCQTLEGEGWNMLALNQSGVSDLTADPATDYR